jgi:hypothetical protein
MVTCGVSNSIEQLRATGPPRADMTQARRLAEYVMVIKIVR